VNALASSHRFLAPARVPDSLPPPHSHTRPPCTSPRPSACVVRPTPVSALCVARPLLRLCMYIPAAKEFVTVFQKHYKRVLGSCIIFNTPVLFPVCKRGVGAGAWGRRRARYRSGSRGRVANMGRSVAFQRGGGCVVDSCGALPSACGVQTLWKTVEPLLARFHKDRVVWLKGEGDQGSLSQLGKLLGHGTLTSVLGACLVRAWCGVLPAVALSPDPPAVRAVPTLGMTLPLAACQAAYRARNDQVCGVLCLACTAVLDPYPDYRTMSACLSPPRSVGASLDAGAGASAGAVAGAGAGTSTLSPTFDRLLQRASPLGAVAPVAFPVLGVVGVDSNGGAGSAAAPVRTAAPPPEVPMAAVVEAAVEVLPRAMTPVLAALPAPAAAAPVAASAPAPTAPQAEDEPGGFPSTGTQDVTSGSGAATLSDVKL
jgi:hypothetical protein